MFASAVYPIATAVVIVAAIVYCSDDVRTAYRLTLAGLAAMTIATVTASFANGSSINGSARGSRPARNTL